MIRSVASLEPVHRRAQLVGLRPLLQGVLGISQVPLHFRKQWRPVIHDEAPRSINPAIEIEGSDQRLAGIAQDGRLLPPPGTRLAGRHDDRLVNSAGDRHTGAGFHPDKRVEFQGQRPFALAGKARHQHLGDEETQNPVAQEFKAFVVLLARTRMGEGALQEAGIAELVSEVGKNIRAGSVLGTRFLSGCPERSVRTGLQPAISRIPSFSRCHRSRTR